VQSLLSGAQLGYSTSEICRDQKSCREALIFDHERRDPEAESMNALPEIQFFLVDGWQQS